MNYSPITFNAINVELFCAITHNIERDPEYFIKIIFEKENTEMHKHLLLKFRKYGNISNFALMLDTELLKTLNLYITGQYNEKIKKQIVIRSDYNY